MRAGHRRWRCLYGQRIAATWQLPFDLRCNLPRNALLVMDLSIVRRHHWRDEQLPDKNQTTENRRMRFSQCKEPLA